MKSMGPKTLFDYYFLGGRGLGGGGFGICDQWKERLFFFFFRGSFASPQAGFFI